MSKNFVDNDNATALMGAVEESIANTRIFKGTFDEYNALTPEEKAKYSYVATPKIPGEAIADAVTDGDMRPVTSNAVYGEIQDINNGLTQRLSTDYPKRTYANAIEYEKRNGICCITFKSAVTASASFTLPDEFSTDLYLTARGTSGNSYAVLHMSNGHPLLEYYYDGSNGLYATITYPAIN